MSPQSGSDADEEAEMAATQWELDVEQDDPEVDIVEIVSELEVQPTGSLPPLYEVVDSLIPSNFRTRRPGLK